MDDKNMRRAGLDYHQYASIQHHQTFDDFLSMPSVGTIYACTTKGNRYHSNVSFTLDDTLLFGSLVAKQ